MVTEIAKKVFFFLFCCLTYLLVLRRTHSQDRVGQRTTPLDKCGIRQS